MRRKEFGMAGNSIFAKIAALMNVSPLEVLRTRIYTVEIYPDGFFYLKTDNDVHQTVRDLKEAIAIIRKHSDEKKALVLLDTGKDSLSEKEVREYAASEEVNRLIKAEAIIATTLSHQLLVNAYLRLNKPGRPSKAFRDEKKAIEWLKTFR